VTSGPIVFCVHSDDLAAGRSETRAAAGLAHALVDRGHNVAIIDRERWPRLPAAALVVSLSAHFDPAWVPGSTPIIAWVLDRLDVWSDLRQLSVYDAVLVSSRSGVARLADAFGGPMHVLPVGLDTGLFWTHPVRRPSATVVALDKIDVPSYFALPDLYRNAMVVVDQGDSTTAPFGTRISRVLESLACGALPVTTDPQDLADLGVAETPVRRSPDEMDQVVQELLTDPETTMATSARLGRHVRAEHSWERRASAFLSLVQPILEKSYEQRSSVRPATLGFFPDYRQANPYQTMLYADLPAHDVTPIPVDAGNGLVPRDPAGPLDHYVFHLHWTAPLLQQQRGPFGAELALRRFRQRLCEFRDRGGRLLWTIHNVLPHECPNRTAEIELCRFLAAQADMVHLMGAATARIVAPLYELPADRTVVIPHSSYLGVYPDVVSRRDARHHLKLREHEIALLMLGGIRPYKDLGLLLDVFEELSRSDARLRLLVVGRPSRDAATAGWQRRCEEHPRIVAHFAHVADADVQIWCRAADLAVLPYMSILNSGSFQLAISFDLPVVGARDGLLAELLDPAYSEAFTPGSAADLRRALEAATRRLVGRPGARLAARVAARTYPPSAMARDFTDAVLPLFATRSVTSGEQPVQATTIGSPRQ
jgi:glycosyltransferase involved in cell wall biosynthesis